jgi:hypothetical protein
MKCTISQIYFDTELYMLQTGLLSIIRSRVLVYTATGICRTGYADCLLVRSGWIPALASKQSA